MTENEFYIWQLRDALKDILAIAKPQWTFSGQAWDSRVARAKYLLNYGPLHPYKELAVAPQGTTPPTPVATTETK